MNAWTPGSLLFFLSQISDPRSPKGRQHSLPAILGASCSAILCGARGFTAIGEWLKNQELSRVHRLGFTRTPPTFHGIRKVLIALDVRALETALTQWVEHLLGRSVDGGVWQAFALDGKTSRGSFDGLAKAVHLLSLVAHESGLTLAQTRVPDGTHDKTNEHKTALKLLDGLVLQGRVITGDAMFCHRDICQKIRDQKGDYFLFVKENQPTLLDDIKTALAPPTEGAFSPSAGKNLAR